MEVLYATGAVVLAVDALSFRDEHRFHAEPAVRDAGAPSASS